MTSQHIVLGTLLEHVSLCSRPKLMTENGHLYIIAAGDKNLTFRTSGNGYVNFNGDNLSKIALMVSFIIKL